MLREACLRIGALISVLTLTPLLCAAAPERRGDFWKAPPEPAASEASPRLPQAIRLPGIRHWHYMLRGVPDAYVDARSSIRRNAAALEGGRKLYVQHCASCHGATGFGVAGETQSLLPSPALLSFLVQKPIAVDEYLLWSIAEGGVAFDTAMPAFKDKLTRDEIWQIVMFMRAGFPEEGK